MKRERKMDHIMTYLTKKVSDSVKKKKTPTIYKVKINENIRLEQIQNKHFPSISNLRIKI